MSTGAEILIRRVGRLGRITLNRPRAINALTLEMVHSIVDALGAWETDDAVRTVLIDGAGERGLCAGADIRALRDAVLTGDDLGDRFFAHEYAMNAQFASYPKPIITFMDGIVMGGGIGLSAHASHRLVTERSQIAMPEVGIGFMPDVGATWLLSRAPGELGTHVALTGASIDGASAIRVGLADRLVASADLAALAAALETDAVHEVIPSVAGDDGRLVAATAVPPVVPIDDDRSWIDACYRFDTVAQILAALDARSEPAATEAARLIRTRSPLALVVTLRALRAALSLHGLDDALERELVIARAFLRTDDYVEGVRAAVVDKDRNPQWRPSTIDAVTEPDLAPFFPPA